MHIVVMITLLRIYKYTESSFERKTDTIQVYLYLEVGDFVVSVCIELNIRRISAHNLLNQIMFQ